MALFSKKYQAQIEIHSTVDRLWGVLMDLDQYGSWNPFTIQVETDWQPGSRVLLIVQMRENRKPIRQVEYLTRLNPKQELAWGMNWGIWLKAERTQRIVRVSSTTVRYETEDRLRGLLCPLVHLLYGRHIQNGFEKMAAALKNHIEQA